MFHSTFSTPQTKHLGIFESSRYLLSCIHQVLLHIQDCPSIHQQFDCFLQPRQWCHAQSLFLHRSRIPQCHLQTHNDVRNLQHLNLSPLHSHASPSHRYPVCHLLKQRQTWQCYRCLSVRIVPMVLG